MTRPRFRPSRRIEWTSFVVSPAPVAPNQTSMALSEEICRTPAARSGGVTCAVDRRERIRHYKFPIELPTISAACTGPSRSAGFRQRAPRSRSAAKLGVFLNYAATVLRPRTAPASPRPANPKPSIAQVDNSGTVEKLVTMISSEPATKRSPRGFWNELFNTKT